MKHWVVPPVLLSVVLSTSALSAQELVHPVLTLASDASPATGRLASISRLRFHAYGREFVLDLQNNDRLKADLPPTVQARLEGIQIYRGSLEGYPGSWLRLTAHDDVISGVIFDGSELYHFRREAGRSTIQPDIETDAGAGTLVGDVARSATSGVLTPDSRKTALGALGGPLRLGKTLAVGVVADSAYDAEHFAHTRASLLETMNVVDGIFLWQLGVRISLAELQILDSSNDPFVNATAPVFLTQLSTLKTSTPALAPLGLVHLFTGRDVLGSSQGGNLVGAANIGTVCDVAAGVGVTESRSRSADARVAAHEIGHNFGAPHDNEAGSACAATPAGHLMEAFDNGSSEFSPCSIDRMVPVVASATCLVDWQPNDLAVRVIGGTSETNLLTERGYLSVAIDNVGVGASNAVELIVETTPSISLSAVFEPSGSARMGFTCERTSSYGRCTASYLPAGSTANFNLEFFTLTPDGGAITVTVNSGNDPNSSNNSLVFPVTVPPAVDIATSLRLTPGQARAGENIFYPGDLVEVTSTLKNLSTTTATNVVATFDFSHNASDYAIDAPIGLTCTGAAFSTRLQCPIGALPGGEQRDFVLTFRTRGGDASRTNTTVSSAVVGDQHDPYRENNQASETVSTTNGIFDLVLDAVYPGTVEIGAPATFTLSLHNLGPDAARFVSLTYSQTFAPPRTFEFLSVTSNLADCSRALLPGIRSCAIVDTVASGETLLITYEFVAKGPLDFFATPRVEYTGYELGMNPEPPTIHIHAEAAAPTPAPSPQPAPPPTSTPAASGSGGGGAVEILTLLMLLLMYFVRGRPAASRAAANFGRSRTSRNVEAREHPSAADRPGARGLQAAIAPRQSSRAAESCRRTAASWGSVATAPDRTWPRTRAISGCRRCRSTR